MHAVVLRATGTRGQHVLAGIDEGLCDRGDLVGCLALAEDDLGQTAAAQAIGVHASEIDVLLLVGEETKRFFGRELALLDLDEPWKVIARTKPYILNPRELYELAGDVPNVVFPCATLQDGASGKIAIYYGCADTVTSVAFGYVQEIVDFIKANNLIK